MIWTDSIFLKGLREMSLASQFQSRWLWGSVSKILTFHPRQLKKDSFWSTWKQRLKKHVSRQEYDLYQISRSSIMLTLGTLIIKQLILQGLLVTTEAPGSFLESENLTKLECTGLLGRWRLRMLPRDILRIIFSWQTDKIMQCWAWDPGNDSHRRRTKVWGAGEIEILIDVK